MSDAGPLAIAAETTRSSRNTQRTANLVMAVLILLGGFFLRIHHLAVKDIWWDEAHSWWYAAKPLAQGITEGMAAWHGAAGDPLFTVLLHLWIGLVGDSAFAMRFLSVIATVITAAYLGRVSARAFGWKTGQVALLLGASAPIWVFYAQEVRQYSLTPGILLILLEGVICVSKNQETQKWSGWTQLALGEAIALYTHSFLIFAAAGINLWLGWMWLRTFRSNNKWDYAKRWATSQIAVILLISPTIPVYLHRLNAGHSAFVQSLGPRHIFNAQWSLLMGIPWDHATDAIPLRMFSTVILLLVLPGIGLALRRAKSRLLADLFWYIAITQSMTVVYWMINPILHPRYMLYLTSPILMMISLLMIRGWEQGALWRLYSIFLVISLGGASFFSVHDLYTGRLLGFSHNSTKAMIDYLTEHFSGQDGIVSIDPNDYTLAYYDPGAAPLFRAGLDDGIHSPADLAGFLSGKREIGVVRFHAERSDTREIVPFYLERFGRLVKHIEVPGYQVDTYVLDPMASLEEPIMQVTNVHWQGIELVGESIQSSDAITVALHWQTDPGFHTDTQLAAIVQIIDPLTDWQLARSSSLLLSAEGAPTSEWAGSENTIQYVVLPLLPGTPPINAELLVTLIDSETGQALDIIDTSSAPKGQQAILGNVILRHAPEHWEYPASRRPIQFVPISSPLIRGYAIDWPTSTPGGTAKLTIQWLAAPQELLSNAIRFEVRQGSSVIALDHSPVLQGRQPASVTPGSVWLDRRVLNISRDAQPGPADVILVTEEDETIIAQVEIAGFERHMQRPLIDSPLEVSFGDSVLLLGYRLNVPTPFTSTMPLPITLYWEALADGEPNRNYAITVQLLDSDGRLIGQHDGMPVFGTRPTSGWIRGEYLLDEHLITFRETYQGQATIQVSVYDAITFERLRIATGADAAILPITLKVESDPNLP